MPCRNHASKGRPSIHAVPQDPRGSRLDYSNFCVMLSCSGLPEALGQIRPGRHSGRRVAGLAQWLRIELAPGVVYENAPGPDRKHHWVVPLHAIEPRDTAVGEEIAVGGWYDAQTLALWAE